MRRFIWFDLKRLFANKVTLVLSILTPVVTLLIFASVISPLFFTNKYIGKVSVVILNEDSSEYIDVVLDDILNSKNLKSVVDAEFVNSLAEGQEKIDHGEAALLVRIPANFENDLYYRKPVTLDVWVNPDYAFEAAVLLPIFDHVIAMFNQMQLGMDYILEQMLPYTDVAQAYDRYNNLMVLIGIRMLNRSDLFHLQNISPLGKYLPVEYYLSAIYAIFLAFGMIPLAGYSAADFTGAELSRGLVHFRWRYTFLLTRILTGTLYILLLSLPLILAGFFLCGFGSFFGGNFIALLFAMLLSAFSFSSAAVFIALLFPKNDTAVWVSFYLVLLFAFAGGVLIPPSYLPVWVNTIGSISPIRASMVLTALSLFNFDIGQTLYPVLVLMVMMILAAICAVPVFSKRLEQ